MKVLFIDVNAVKKKSIIDGNLDTDKIIWAIEQAQEIHVHNYLGTKLYEKLQDLIADDTINDAGNEKYKTLVTDYIQNMLIWFTQVEFLPFANFKLTNGGVFKHESEADTQADTDDIAYLVKNCSNKAEYYAKRFVDFMCFNSSNYPEYRTNRNDDLYPDKDPSFNIGWVI